MQIKSAHINKDEDCNKEISLFIFSDIFFEPELVADFFMLYSISSKIILLIKNGDGAKISPTLGFIPLI